MANTTLPMLLAAVAAASDASAFDYEAYGSLRIQVESVDPDDTAAMDSYGGWRDAYSRVGLKVNHGLTDQVDGYAQVELPVDVPNLELQDPWDQTTHVRIAKVGVRGAFGDVAVGKMWLPYYNAIAYPVDMFSSYYSGFATYTTFRRSDTAAYYTPEFRGLSAGLGYSRDNGAAKSNGRPDDRSQLTLSYTHGDLMLAGGIDDLGGVSDTRIWGASVAWRPVDAVYVGAKAERFDSDLGSGYGADGDTAMNLYAAYTTGKNTFKAMIADVENYGETVLHIGWDHQYRDDFKLFAEYYREQETAAITTRGGGAAETCWACNGGQVFTAGFRYDFSTP